MKSQEVVYAAKCRLLQQIVRLRHEDNLSIGAIKTSLRSQRCCSWYPESLCEDGKSTGRSRKTSERDDRTIATILKSDRFETAAAVSREFNVILKKNLSRQTVHRRLAEHD